MSKLTTGVLLLCALLAGGCAASRPPGTRPFVFPDDTLSYTNETQWVYRHDPATGRQWHEPRVPEPAYALRCFVMTRVVRQFFAHAAFEPANPEAADIPARVREVLRRNPRRFSAPEQRVVFPGFAHLHDLSARHAAQLQAEAGGAWQSYVQRGNWRMVLPFTRRGQAREAERLRQAIRENRPPVVHLTEFPRLRMNHGMLLHGFTENAGEISFLAYDPNQPDEPVELTFDRKARRFRLPPLPYYVGGPVNVYEVYRGWWK